MRNMSSNRSYQLVLTALAWCFFCQLPLFGITFSQDFDSGSLDVSATTVVDNNVFLEPRKTWTASGVEDAYRWVYFRASTWWRLSQLFILTSRRFLGPWNVTVTSIATINRIGSTLITPNLSATTTSLATTQLSPKRCLHRLWPSLSRFPNNAMGQ